MMPRWDCVFVDVDTQHDFLDTTGALYVPASNEIVPNLRRLVAAAAACRVPILSSADNHPPNDPEFRRFPPHCVRGTSGQAKLRQTLLDNRTVFEPADRITDPASLLEIYAQIVFHKTTFDVFSNPNFERLIDAIDVGRYVVFGVATDYCVRAAVLGLRRRGRQVMLVGDAIRAVAARTEAEACREFHAAGVIWTTTDHVVDMVGRAAKDAAGADSAFEASRRDGGRPAPDPGTS